jgi:glucose-6-phosphate dehydrogenase assembly protein OpcA
MSAPVATPSKPVDVAGIEQALAELWQYDAGEDRPVTRAVMSNLVIFAASAEQATRIPDEIARIVQSHPARVLLLRSDPHQPDRAVEAHVSALCQLAGDGRQICSEYIVVEATDQALHRLPYTVRSLLLGDLPTSLWWATRQAPPLAGELFADLAGMSNQVIYESLAWSDPVEGLVVTADWALAGPPDLAVADLEWRRLKHWRRLMSQNLDPAVTPGALDQITEVRVQHGPHALPKAWLLIGWLASRLGWHPKSARVQPGHDITWSFQAGRPIQAVALRQAKAEPYKVHEVMISWPGGSLTFSRLGPGMLTVIADRSDAKARVLVVPSQSRALLVAKQLPKLGRDPIFLEALTVARGMAAALRG